MELENRHRMKRFILYISLLLVCVGVAYASPYRISLLTGGPGDELYAGFGHSALRVVNEETGGETVYNFGMFNFATPNFYPKFVKGDLDYYLAKESFRDFMWEFDSQKRYVHEQVLSLTDEQTERIMKELQERYLPENRAYRYKFIQRNCTTELRDIIVAAVDADTEFLESADRHTWRYYLSGCLPDDPWTRIGINIVLGSKVDVRINRFERMCFPALLYEGLPLVAEDLVKEDVLVREDARERSGWMGRNYPYIIIVVLALALVFANSRTADSVYLFVLGVLGLLVVFLMYYSTHMEFKLNFNLLWCNPLFIALGIAVLKKWPKWTFVLSTVSLLCLLVLLVIWITGVQGLDPAFIVFYAAALWISLKYYTGYRKAFRKNLS